MKESARMLNMSWSGGGYTGVHRCMISLSICAFHST